MSPRRTRGCGVSSGWTLTTISTTRTVRPRSGGGKLVSRARSYRGLSGTSVFCTSGPRVSIAISPPTTRNRPCEAGYPILPRSASYRSAEGVTAQLLAGGTNAVVALDLSGAHNSAVQGFFLELAGEVELAAWLGLADLHRVAGVWVVGGREPS